ncbi:hypothetical protein GA0115240_128520 [Streptomyces sp. DvalAA-14]|uniref:DUF3558 domain-containing protein n=1 Tax=unclassified Streptomyces TaxID=2593676 RepID=UPI00081B81C9|nr:MULTISPECIES: DUF3558 domain-containing protein [unclassified Streptomyces]SCD88600.1 hypothetical protein GA0115240_128520 [Streptomyces sp. DvalAA-14]
MERRRRTAPRLAGLLACAAVPAMLLAGCSSGSGSASDSGAKDGGGDSAGSAPGTTAPAVAPARFSALPASCKTVTKATVTALVPKAKSSGGTESQSSDAGLRGGCSWTGNGKDGYQYRWLSVTLQRFTSSAELGGAQDQAEKRYADQLAQLGAAKGFTTSAVAGVGDQASAVSGRATVAHVTSQNATVVTRTGNVVLIVELDGAGFEGKKNPTAHTITSGAERAAKDAVASVQAANPGAPAGASGSAGSGSSGTPGTSGASPTGSAKGGAPKATASGSGGLSG